MFLQCSALFGKQLDQLRRTFTKVRESCLKWDGSKMDGLTWLHVSLHE